MTAKTECASPLEWRQIAEQTRGIGTLERLLDVLIRAALKVSPFQNRPTPPVAMLIKFGAATFGARLVKARDLDDLDGLLERMIDSPKFQEFQSFLEAKAVVSARMEASTVPTWVTDVYGAGSADLLLEGLSLGAEISGAVQQLQKIMGGRPRAVGTAASRLDFLSTVHPSISRSLVAALKGNAVFFGMAQAVIDSHRREPWLNRALAEAWVKGRREHLRVLASTPGVEVSQVLMPVPERLDLASLAKEMAETNAMAHSVAIRAREGGKLLYALPTSTLHAQ